MRQNGACHVRRDHAGVREDVRAAREGRLVGRPIRHPAVQRVVKHTKAATEAGLSVPKGIPSKADAGGKILSVREVPAFWRSFIPREYEPGWRIHEPCRLQTRDNAETESSRIGFRGGVLIAEPERQCEARRYFPLVLSKRCVLLLVFITRGFGELKVFVRSTEQKVGQVISGPDTVRSSEIEAPVGLVGIDRILLHNRKAATKLPGVAPAIPGQRIRKSISIVSLPMDVWIKANDHAAGEKQLCGAKGIV